jgi:Domain of unknown function (DUF4129)
VTQSPLSRVVRALMLAALALVLLGLVVVAAGGYRLGGSGSTQASPYAVDTMLTIVLAVYAIGAVALLVGTFWAGAELRRNPKLAAKRRSSLPALMATLVLLALLFGLATRFHLRVDLARLHPPSTAAATVDTSTPAPRREKARPRTSHEPRFQLLPFLAVLAAAGAGFGALFVAERRRKRRLPRDPAVREALVETLDETLDDLRQERDPRRAVIAAYVRMERVLAAHGIPRRRFEAPHEYLGRVLADLTRRSRAAERLTELFERARFSAHEIPPAMKEDAIAAAEDLQAELAAAELERAA